MAVETYEIEEVANEQPEVADEARRLIDELGLEGQKASDDETSTQRFPYRKMTEDERAVYGVICPTKTKMEEYSMGQIPLRVLQVIAHARDSFDHIVVWHPKGVEKDLVLVGEKGFGWNTTNYILARWGDELDEWPAVLKRATAIFRERTLAKLRMIVTEVNGKIVQLEAGYSGTEFLEKHTAPMFSW